MLLKNSHFDDQNIYDLVQKIESPMKEFTQSLKKFYKIYGSDWKFSVSICRDDSIELFKLLSTYILNENHNREFCYNAYRCIGISLNARRDVIDFYLDAMELVKNTYIHPYGNFRTQAYHFLGDLLFCSSFSLCEPISSQKETKKHKKNASIVYPALIDFYKWVVTAEQEREDEIYPNMHRKRKEQIWYMAYSWDTADKTLKSCRKIIERFDCKHYIEKFKEYGYVMKWSSENDIDNISIEKHSPIIMEAEFELFVKDLRLDIDFTTVKQLIYEDDGTMKAFHAYMGYIFDASEEAGVELEQGHFDFIATLWATFPHKCLWGKAPQDMYD